MLLLEGWLKLSGGFAQRLRASEAWTWASVLPASANPVSRWFSDSAVQVWHLGYSALYGDMMLDVWTKEEVTKSGDGMWPVFAFLCEGIGVQRVAGGRVLLGGRIALDLNFTLRHWQHQVRFILRVWWAVQAQQNFCQVLRIDGGAVKKLLGHIGCPVRSSAATLVTGSYFTRLAQWESFGDVSPFLSDLCSA